ncbi:hypothetical protein G6F38_012794 [Rhizopus arrhizus]|nr:hypothetical protein G6F38_012794 [Rhizopus arrhizus]
MSLALSTDTGQKLDLTEVAADLKAVGTGLLGLREVRLVLEAVVLDSTAAEVDLVIRKADLVGSPKKGSFDDRCIKIVTAIFKIIIIKSDLIERGRFICCRDISTACSSNFRICSFSFAFEPLL